MPAPRVKLHLALALYILPDVIVTSLRTEEEHTFLTAISIVIVEDAHIFFTSCLTYTYKQTLSLSHTHTRTQFPTLHNTNRLSISMRTSTAHAPLVQLCADHEH